MKSVEYFSTIFLHDEHTCGFDLPWLFDTYPKSIIL